MGLSGLEVSTVNEALYYLKTHCFRVILLDLQLPGETSLAIADYVEMMGLDATIILITGTGIFPRGENLEVAPRIDYVLRKPVRSRDLAALIDHALNRPPI